MLTPSKTDYGYSAAIDNLGYLKETVQSLQEVKGAYHVGYDKDAHRFYSGTGEGYISELYKRFMGTDIGIRHDIVLFNDALTDIGREIHEVESFLANKDVPLEKRFAVQEALNDIVEIYQKVFEKENPLKVYQERIQSEIHELSSGYLFGKMTVTTENIEDFRKRVNDGINVEEIISMSDEGADRDKKRIVAKIKMVGTEEQSGLVKNVEVQFKQIEELNSKYQEEFNPFKDKMNQSEKLIRLDWNHKSFLGSVKLGRTKDLSNKLRVLTSEEDYKWAIHQAFFYLQPGIPFHRAAFQFLCAIEKMELKEEIQNKRIQEVMEKFLDIPPNKEINISNIKGLKKICNFDGIAKIKPENVTFDNFSLILSLKKFDDEELIEVLNSINDSVKHRRLQQTKLSAGDFDKIQFALEFISEAGERSFIKCVESGKIDKLFTILKMFEFKEDYEWAIRQALDYLQPGIPFHRVAIQFLRAIETMELKEEIQNELIQEVMEKFLDIPPNKEINISNIEELKKICEGVKKELNDVTIENLPLYLSLDSYNKEDLIELAKRIQINTVQKIKKDGDSVEAKKEEILFAIKWSLKTREGAINYVLFHGLFQSIYFKEDLDQILQSVKEVVVDLTLEYELAACFMLSTKADKLMVYLSKQLQTLLSELASYKLLCLRFSLKGSIPCSQDKDASAHKIPMEGLSQDFGGADILKLLAESVAKYKSQDKVEMDFGPIIDSLSSPSSEGYNPNTLFTKYHNYEPCVISINEPKHRTAVVYQKIDEDKGLVIYCNKGDRANNKKPGLKIMRKKNSLMDEDHFRGYFIDPDSDKPSEKEFKSQSDIFEQIVPDETLAIFPAKWQKSGNCPWASAKLAFRALILLQLIDEGTIEIPNKDNILEVKNKVDPIYFGWRTYDLKSSYDELMSHIDNDKYEFKLDPMRMILDKCRTRLPAEGEEISDDVRVYQNIADDLEKRLAS